MDHPKASEGDLENQQVLRGIDKIQGEHTNSLSIDSLVQKLGGMYNLYEHRQNSAKVKGNIQPL